MPTVINSPQPGGSGSQKQKTSRPGGKPGQAGKGRKPAVADPAQEKRMLAALAVIIVVAIGFLSVYLFTGNAPRKSSAIVVPPAAPKTQGTGTAFGANLGAPGAGQRDSASEYGPHGMAGFEASPEAGGPGVPQRQLRDDE